MGRRRRRRRRAPRVTAMRGRAGQVKIAGVAAAREGGVSLPLATLSRFAAARTGNAASKYNARQRLFPFSARAENARAARLRGAVTVRHCTRTRKHFSPPIRFAISFCVSEDNAHDRILTEQKKKKKKPPQNDKRNPTEFGIRVRKRAVGPVKQTHVNTAVALCFGARADDCRSAGKTKYIRPIASSSSSSAVQRPPPPATFGRETPAGRGRTEEA